MRANSRGVMHMPMILLTTALVPAVVHAQIYSCKDSSGRTLTSDREIPECASRDMREIGKNGLVKRVIAAPLTAEQRRAKQADEERARQQADAALEARRRDQALLARFRNEAEIDRAHQRALGDLQEKIHQSDRALALATNHLREVEIDAARRSNNKAVPPNTQRIDEAKTLVTAENNRRLKIQNDLAQLDQSFDETRKRYRELTNASAAK